MKHALTRFTMIAAAVLPTAIALATPAPDPNPGAGPSTSSSSSSSASAQASASSLSASSSAPARASAPPRELAPPGPRQVPDYDGRPEAPATAGDVALWVPRVVLFIPYVVTEYVIRQPLGWLVRTAEINQWPSKVVDFFTFGPSNNAGLVPTAFIDFGLKPSVGVYFWVDGLGPKENSLRLHFGTWGEDWLSIAVTDRLKLSDKATLSLSGSWVKRPDYPYFGLGPSSSYDNFSRYSSTTSELSLLSDVTPTRWSRIRVSTGVRHVTFDAGDCCDEPSITALIANGRLPVPPGFLSGYTDLYQRAEIVLDSRRRRPAVQHGARLAIDVEHGKDAEHDAGSRWLKWGGTLGGYIDVGSNRVVGLKTTAMFVEALRGTTPFTEQVRLGGSGPMRGYLLGRLVDQSAAVAELEYRWPVWVFLDGTVHTAVGNVFGEHLEGFSAKLLRLSAAIGLKSSNSADHQFEILTGLGTETFESGAKVTSFRLVFGGNRGF